VSALGERTLSNGMRQPTRVARIKSMQNRSLHYFFSRVFHAHFDVVVRKLIFELQARYQRILVAPMGRVNLPIDLENIILMKRTIGRDPIFHETPHQ